MAIAQKYLNYLDLKVRMAQDAANAEKDVPIMELIDGTNITKERKLEILDGYIATLEADKQFAITKRLELT